jgi:hypothetical protein
MRVTLPGGERYRLSGGPGFAPPPGKPTSRVAYAAAHVVADPHAENVPGAPATVDWEATLRFRHHLWRHGFGVAEAMDTAQRGPAHLAQSLRLADRAGLLPDAELAAARTRAYFATAGVDQ